MMNINPWNIDTPFDDFFVEEISFAGLSSTVKCCIFPIEDIDPFSDSTTENETQKINVLVKISDLSSKPNIGDSFSLIDSSQWGISEIKKEQSWYKIIAREL